MSIQALTYFSLIRYPSVVINYARMRWRLYNSRRHHQSRIREYAKYEMSPKEGITCLTDQLGLANSIMTTDPVFIEWAHRVELIAGGNLTFEFALCLYNLVRALKPTKVVETGVANGFSSSFLLRGLHDNGLGELYSLDFPNPTLIMMNKKSGWLIPDDLRYRWHLVYGSTFENLLPLCRKLGQIDLFFHDSEHTYQTMTFEFTTIWPFLKKGGLLVADDVDDNDAFLEYCERVNRIPLVIKSKSNTHGLIIK